MCARNRWRARAAPPPTVRAREERRSAQRGALHSTRESGTDISISISSLHPPRLPPLVRTRRGRTAPSESSPVHCTALSSPMESSRHSADTVRVRVRRRVLVRVSARWWLARSAAQRSSRIPLPPAHMPPAERSRSRSRKEMEGDSDSYSYQSSHRPGRCRCRCRCRAPHLCARSLFAYSYSYMALRSKPTRTSGQRSTGQLSLLLLRRTRVALGSRCRTACKHSCCAH